MARRMVFDTILHDSSERVSHCRVTFRTQVRPAGTIIILEWTRQILSAPGKGPDLNISRKRFTLAAMSFLASTSLPFSLNAQTSSSRVMVTITGVRNSKGKVEIGLWKSKDGFPKDVSKSFRSVFVEIVDGAATTTFANVPYGEYAIAAYHDENNNGKMDSRFPGIPVEGIGSSNNPHPKFGPPSFAECRFEVAQPERVVGIKLQYL